ncbi:[Heparan sulfate]-glucosamine N-sulfotransferase [Aphelenchoides fujianensis]|nr:[Heparan sulfate]-glucosamine N-sulfotransferase [Aphelenchoides fujianensis]
MLPRRPSNCFRLLAGAGITWLLIVFLKSNPPIPRVRYGAHPFPLFQCPHSSNSSPGAVSTFRSVNTQQRILLIRDPASTSHTLILDHLEFLKVSVWVEAIREDPGLLLEDRNGGRFSLIVFANFRTFDSLSAAHKSALANYSTSYRVGVISFAQPAKTPLPKGGSEADCRGRLQFVAHTGIPRIARSRVPIDLSGLARSAWSLTSLPEWTPVLEAAFNDGSAGAVIALRKEPFQHVLFGHNLDLWPVKLGFADVLHYFLGSEVVGSLERFIQIDIDDIFVGQVGALLVERDVDVLVQTQREWRDYVEDFHFTLGFSGSFFRHGTDEEKAGDSKLIERAKEFLWFPHMWRHNHAQEYDETNLTLFMNQNKEFAMSNNLNISLDYAVAPQHSGVYPIHEPLYAAWRNVWNVEVSSTEEYPHFSPPSRRRAFVHRNISVLPRQTCGLYTHTLYFHAMPDGMQKHVDSIQGGSLFTSVLFNQFSIFMTHQQNFANDRLSVFTFSTLFRFLRCWTNLRLKWTPPVDLARRYFERFPSERSLLHTDVCKDRRHVRMLSVNETCSDVKRTPNVFGVGPQKTGTTALREYLLLHPNTSSNRMVPDGFFEEPQFFGGPNYQRGVNWYRSLFNETSDSSAVVFEKTANYFDNPHAAKAIAQFAPDAKIVVILIDPVDRAYSWFQHAKAHGDPAAANRTAKDALLGPTDDRAVLKLRSRCFSPGFYVEHLERWLDHFSPAQLVILNGKELRENPAHVMNELTSKLALPPAFDYRNRLLYDERKGFFCIRAEIPAKRRCLGSGKGRKYEPMTSELRRALGRVFESANRDLLRFLQHYQFQPPSFLLTP